MILILITLWCIQDLAKAKEIESHLKERNARYADDEIPPVEFQDKDSRKRQWGNRIVSLQYLAAAPNL